MILITNYHQSRIKRTNDYQPLEENESDDNNSNDNKTTTNKGDVIFDVDKS